MAFIIDGTQDIEAPAALVWEVITDLPRYGEWNSFCLECRSTLKPGDPIDMLVLLGRKPQRQREWISDYDEGHSFAYSIRSAPLGLLTSGRRQRVESLGPSRSRYHSHFELRGGLSYLVRGLLGRRLASAFAETGNAVKRRAETLWAQRNTVARN